MLNCRRNVHVWQQNPQRFNSSKDFRELLIIFNECIFQTSSPRQIQVFTNQFCFSIYNTVTWALSLNMLLKVHFIFHTPQQFVAESSLVLLQCLQSILNLQTIVTISLKHTLLCRKFVESNFFSFFKIGFVGNDLFWNYVPYRTLLFVCWLRGKTKKS